jgi:hypothetical protein
MLHYSIVFNGVPAASAYVVETAGLLPAYWLLAWIRRYSNAYLLQLLRLAHGVQGDASVEGFSDTGLSFEVPVIGS